MDRVRTCFFWPACKVVVTCPDCASSKMTGPAPRAPIQTFQTLCSFERLAMDILGPPPHSDKRNLHTVVIADYFTKLAEAFSMFNQEARAVAEIFDTEFVLRLGVPRTLHTDQGRNFKSRLFQHVCSLFDMHKTRTSPSRPSSDGLVEKLNCTLTTMLSNFVNSNQSDWDVVLPLPDDVP